MTLTTRILLSGNRSVARRGFREELPTGISHQGMNKQQQCEGEMTGHLSSLTVPMIVKKSSRSTFTRLTSWPFKISQLLLILYFDYRLLVQEIVLFLALDLLSQLREMPPRYGT